MIVKKLFSSNKAKRDTVPRTRNLNPYADFLSADPSTRPAHASSPSCTHAMSPTKSGLSIPSSYNKTQKRPEIDVLFDFEKERLIEAFNIIDLNGDGQITEYELGVMWKRLGKKISDQELRLMIVEADTNGDGVIDLEEFVALHKSTPYGITDSEKHAEEIRVAFAVADTARDGLISAFELQKVMKRLGKRKVTLAQCTEMIRWVDSDGDNLITLAEFEKLMMSSVYANKCQKRPRERD